jgi:DNA-binding response OmpR family regulator
VAAILVVEDDKDLNFAYQLILERAGHEVETAFNGQEALDKLRVFWPDLILLDLLMPVKSGVEFLKAYDPPREHPQAKVLIFTNIDRGPEISEALRLGADKAVIKAWTAPQGLVKVVENILADVPAEARK